MDSATGMWLALACLLGGAMAQSVIPQNGTAMSSGGVNDTAIYMAVSMGDNMVPLAPIVPLSTTAATDIPPPGLSGPVILANTSNYLSLQHDSIAVVACDLSAYPGNIGALNVLNAAAQANASAVVWYSTQAEWCHYEAPATFIAEYPWVYSMGSLNDTKKMLDEFDSLRVGDADTSVYVAIGPPDTANQVVNSTQSGSGDGNGNGSGGGSHGQPQTNQSPLGPSPGTAVAMIILYSITGIITALFLVIIVTGAIRAHRHPERYGPRNIIGRPRQSRAKGIARAMLETIPIVKFGDREAPKPTDVELADGAAPDVRSETRDITADTARGNGDDTAAAPRRSMAEGGIAAAAPHAQDGAADPDNQGCSICTEDFEIGQDQRVLPCNHRFHPECIDPWLLNVSGTCPLCRIDLRPRASTEPELDEHGNPISREDGEDGEDGLPPPLGQDDGTRRTSVRRSIIQGLIGARPERMTRQERLTALRQYRVQAAMEADRRRRESAPTTSSVVVAETETPEQERRLRARLRNAFRVRTRRTGQEEPAVEASPSSPGAENDESSR